MSRRSREARRQKEREEASRRKLREQSYRETQRNVYERIYREQDEMPDDYGEAFREDEPRGGGKPRRGRTVLIVLLLMLLALVGAALAAHSILVHRPELPQEEPAETIETPDAPAAGRREDVYTFLLVGRDDKGGGNTDTIMVGCFDTKNGSLDVLSIYRDTLVDVPWEIKKINSVYNFQGIDGLLDQVKNLIGYRPDYYFVVELSAVTQLVDAIGGVDFDVPYNMHYDDPSQNLHIHLEKGMQHLDGENAVRLLRWRKNNSGESLSVGDVGRVEIQHSFLKALAEQTIRLGNVTKLRQIAAIADKNITSNLTYGEMLWFAEQILGVDRENIRFYGLPGDYTGTIWSQTFQNYQSYVFVNPTALLEIVNEHLNPYIQPLTAEDQHVIHGTDVNSQPTLPASTGLPILQAGQLTGNEMDLPSGEVQTETEPPEETAKPEEDKKADQETKQETKPEQEPAQPAAPEEPAEPPSEQEPAPETAPEQEPASDPEPASAADPASESAPAPAPESGGAEAPAESAE